MRREGGTKAAGLRGMGTWDSIPSQPEVPPGLLWHRPLPSRAGRSRKLQHSVLGKQTGVRPATWGSADSWLSEAGVGARLSRRAEVARCSPPELLSAGLKLQDLWGRGSQCQSQWQAL